MVYLPGEGGNLYLKLDTILVKKSRNQAMYVRTSFSGAKTRKIGKKGVFLVIMTNFGKDMTDKLRKTHVKTSILGSIFTPESYVFRGCVF